MIADNPGAPQSLVALVPMRHHSERVPGKNFRPLAGRPLYAYILESLLAAGCISKIVVDTDSPVIRDGLERDFPQVQVVTRPAELTDGMVSMNLVIAHDIATVEAPFYLQTHSTNPMLRPATIARAVSTFFANFPERDSLFSATRWQKRLWTAEAAPINHDPSMLLRTQDLPPVFEENSCLYIFERERFQRLGNRLGERPLLFEVPALEAWDVDEEHDFHMVEMLMQEPSGRAGDPGATSTGI